MFLVRLAAGLALTCLCVSSSVAQSPQAPIVIEGDLRVFTTVAALNVAGFDVELAPQYHPARAELRKLADRLDPDLVRRLREYYAAHRNSRPDEEQLAKYISLAVVLTDPPELKPITREEGLPDAAREVLTFVDLLREFYQKAGVTRLWAAIRPSYESEMDRMGPAIREAIGLSDAYLRIPSGLSGEQTMRISVELGAPQNSVNVRSHLDSYYVVLGYSATPKVDEVRHAYLHLRLDGALTSIVAKISKRENLLALLAGQPGVQREYSGNFENMLAESVVRALELRIDRVPAARAEETVRQHYRSGLLLMPYFYNALPAYEVGERGLRENLPAMATAIDAGAEQERFLKTFNTIPIPERQPLRAEVPVAPRVDPVMELLKVAQSAFEKDKPRAREAFEKVLKDHDANNGRALYGMGLIEMDRQNLDEALQFFEATVTSDSAEPSMRTWAYIYAGHILDFKCDRPAALERYRKAAATGDNTRDAQKVVQGDLAKPFGGECPQ